MFIGSAVVFLEPEAAMLDIVRKTFAPKAILSIYMQTVKHVEGQCIK